VAVDSCCWAYGILSQNLFSNCWITVYLSLVGIDAVIADCRGVLSLNGPLCFLWIFGRRSLVLL